MVERYKITIVPINILIGDRIYRDGVDVTADQAYAFSWKTLQLSEPLRPRLPATSMPSKRPAIWPKMQSSSLSSDISTAYNMALVAKDQAKEELPNLNIEVLDSKNVIASGGFIVLEAAHAITEGKGMKAAIAAVEEVKAKATFFSSYWRRSSTSYVQDASSR